MSNGPAGSEVLRSNPRENLLGDFGQLRSDIDWKNVTHFPGMHEGRVLLVTGGAQGLGKDITWWSAVFGGGKVIFCDVQAEQGQSLQGSFREQISRVRSAGEVHFRQLDVTDPKACATLIEQLIDQHGKIDTLISNAGIGTVDTLINTTDAAKMALSRKVMDVNFYGYVNLAGPFVQYVEQGRRAGTIAPDERKKLIAICSIGGVIGLADRFSYGASKFALAGAIKNTIIDHGDIVEVIGVNPARMATEMPLRRIAEAQAGVERDLRAWTMASTQRNQEMVIPSEVGQHVSWLASTCPSTKPLRNTELPMDDGWTAGHQPRLDQIPIELLEGMLKARKVPTS